MEPSVSGGDDGVRVGFPDEGLRVFGIVFADEAVDGGLEIDDGMEDAVIEPAPGELGEEALYGVEPGARGRRELEGEARMAGESGAGLVFLVCGVVVEDDVDGLVRRHLALDAAQEAEELLMAVALHVLPDDRSVEHGEPGEQRRRAVPLVVVGLLHRQAGLGAVERLDLALLVDRQPHGMGRRIDLEADDIGEFLGKGRVVRKLELPPAVRADAVRLPDTLHRRGRDAGDLGHGAQRPVGRFMRRRLECQADDLRNALRRHRCLAGRSGPVAKQAVHTLVHEPLLPAPHAGLRLGGRGHVRRGAQGVGAQKDNTRQPDVLLQVLGVRDDRLHALTVARRDGEGNAMAHTTDSHTRQRKGIPNRTLSFRSIH